VSAGQGWYEAGAEWIDADHHRTIGLLRDIGLEPEPADPKPGRLLYQAQSCLEDAPWADAAKDLQNVRREALKLGSSLLSPPWANDARTDAQTVAEFLDRVCASPRGRWLCEAVLRSDEGTDLDRVSLLGWLVNTQLYSGRKADNAEMSAFRFPDGGQALCEKLADTLRAKPLLDRPVRGVQQSESHVELWLKDEVVFADRAIFTVPPRPLLKIDFEPDIPDDQREAYAGLGSSPCVKVALRFKSRFWDAPTHSGSWLTDLPFQQVWDGGRQSEPLLLCYVCGREAERLSKAPDAAVVSTLDSLTKVYPNAKDEFVEGAFHDWTTDPWALGGFASLSPGTVHGSLPYLRRPHGRVHWAGEATADWIGFVEGALESAERAVQEVLVEEKVLERS
jgi:monoamine oxidase